jgi:hypothetical protein
MPRQFLEYPVRKFCEYHPHRENGSIAVCLHGAARSWRIRIFAQGEDEAQQTGWLYVGSVRTLVLPPADRVVAYACCPGAQWWAVDGVPEDHRTTEHPGVSFMGSPWLLPPGVHPSEGISLPGPRHVVTLAGGSGTPTLPGPIVGYSCIAGAGGATITLTRNGQVSAIPLPPNATFADELDGAAGTVEGITFTGTDSFVVDCLQPGDGADAF